MCPGRSTVARGIDLKPKSKARHFFSRFAIDYEAVGKRDGKRVIPTDTKRNVYIAVENKINGMNVISK